MAVGHAHAQSLAAGSPSMAARHVGGRPGLVDEDQALRIEVELAVEPGLPPLQDVGRPLREPPAPAAVFCVEAAASPCQAPLMSLSFRLLACLLALSPAGGPPPPPAAAGPATPLAVLASAPAADWAAIEPADLLVVDLANGGRVVIALAGAFAPVHVANIRRLAREHWYDGLSVEREQDNYVSQWGDPDGRKPLPAGVVRSPPPEYERYAVGLPLRPLAYPDTYAPQVGMVDGFPVAVDGTSAWLAHCYGMVGVGRDLNPDTGTGAELYAVIGQPIRALDRNIALVGRVVGGMEALSSLPRGKGELGFYTAPAERLAIRQVRIGSDLPLPDQPNLERLRPESATYAAWVKVKAHRQDSFFLRPAGAVDLCGVLPPVRPRTR